MRKTRIEKLHNKFPTITKEYLYDLYVVKQKSLPIIYKECGIDFRACCDLLNYYKIPIRTRSQARQCDAGKERVVNSFKEKYGVENPSQLEWVKRKKENTFKKHYGVDNIWKSKEYYEWLNDYMLIHYGVKRLSPNGWGWKNASQKRKDERIKKLWDGRDKWWASLTDEEKSVMMAKLCSLNTLTSKIETRVSDALNRLHITYRRWIPIGINNFDFKLDNSNLLIEVNGDFWHANPKKYKSDDVVPFPHKSIKACELWKKDEKKRLTAESNGYRMITIWEDELKDMTDRKLEDWLLQKITL